MKKAYIIFIFSLIAFITLLMIQINWIVETAQIKEELFNEKANIVLSRTVEALNTDVGLCSKMNMCCNIDKEHCPMFLADADKQKIDSLLQYYMNYYQFHIDFTFDVISDGKSLTKNENSNWDGNIYKKKLEEVANENGLELNLFFPEKASFILKEIGGIFISSILLIIVLSFFFVMTSLSLIRERRLVLKTNQLLNIITHEFKTPMTNIGLAGQRLQKNSNKIDATKINQYCTIILSENDKLKLQVDQILNLAELERGEISLKLENINFHQLLKERLTCFTMQIEDLKGIISISLNARRFNVLGDINLLSNVLNNLVDNAIKYSPNDLCIEIDTYNSIDKLIIEIKDKGIGIPKEFHRLIFKEYYRIQTGNVHDVKGFGLGLAYVKKVMDLHNGTITVKNNSGKGSIFRLEIPIVDGK